MARKKLVIEVSGGVVQAVYSNIAKLEELEVVVIDWDDTEDPVGKTFVFSLSQLSADAQKVLATAQPKGDRDD